MNQDKLKALAQKVKDASVDGAAKVVAAVNDQVTTNQAKELVTKKVNDAKVYTAESINAAEGFLEEHDAAGKLQKAVDLVGGAVEKVKSGSDKVADHFTNDHFDEQTDEIRDELARQKATDDDEDDIVIDATKDADDDEDSGMGAASEESADSESEAAADQASAEDSVADSAADSEADSSESQAE